MFSDNDTLESLKLKLKSVTKQKLSKEREVLKLRNKERSLIDELNTTRAEVEHLTEHLEHLKNQITQSKHQISMIDMCMASEDLKIETHIGILNEHLGGFQQLFDKDRREMEQRLKEQRDKEAKIQEDLRQKEMQIAEEKERQMREAAAIDEECEVIERECAVLKKRNNAIMLKLRKRLLEAENARREAMKRNAPQTSSDHKEI
ncbi:hypothetical protein PYW08_005558 [Mythimna loreyi]|uniref:Uncharacterized protein n=1 Tax=Mythimna loreyi TaxID=667449 RepID=A0ACC2QIX1_9NEOP|nr:hypothetical protein PYW08_005558 [Mythimna loreyi]